MAVFPQKPRSGQKVLQGLYNSVCQIIDYLPSLEVRGDNSSTSVTKTSNGTIVHSNNGFDSIEDLRARYRFHNGIMAEDNKIYVRSTLTGGRFIDVDYYEQNEQGEEVEKEYPTINCMLSGGRDIQITQGGIINYTGSGGGGASGYTYTGDGDLGSGHIFVDYSYTNPVICSNLCYIDDLLNYPISGGGIGSELHFAQIRDIKDGAGTQVDYHWTSIGDSTEEGGQLIKFIDGVCVNLNVSGGTYITTKFHQGVGYGDYTSASIDCNLSGDRDINNSGLITIVPQYDIEQNITGGVISSVLHAGSGIAIDPQTGEITCTVEGGGGGNTYYADNFTLSTTSPTGNTFYLYDVYPLLTGRGGIRVDRYGDSPLYPGYALGTVISCPVYLPSTGIAILDDTTPGTQNKYVAITADFDYNAGTGISIDPVTRTINCTVEPGGGETYYADESTIKLSSTNNTFYLYDVEPLLTGAGGIKVYNYGLDGLSRRVTGISATPYTGGEGISVDNYVISLTATIPTKTSDLTNDSHFITINDVPPGSVYQGDNVTIAASGTNNNIFYVIDGVFARLSTVVNLSTELSGHIDYVSSNIPLSTSQLVNDVPFVTSTWVDDNFISGGATGDHMYYNSQEKRLKCMLTGGTNIEIEDVGNYGYINCTLTGLDQLDNTCGFVTTDQVSSIVPHIPTSGLMSTALYDANDNLTGIEYGLSTKFYNDLTTISTRPATGDKILSSHNGTLSWETNTAGSNIPTPTANKVLSSNASNQIVWATNTGGSTPTPGEQNYNYIFSSGIYQATAGSKWIVRYPHIPIAWSEYEEGPWPEGWQPPKEPGSDAYFSQQWPLYQYYYDQPTEPALPCGFLCSLYTWAPGEYGSSKSHGHWDIILKLPNVSERTVVEVVNYTDTALIVVTDNQKQIIPQCFNNTIGDDQNYWSTNYPNYAYSFKHGDFNACCKIIFYYDPAPPYTPERTPYASGAMKQLTSGGCWFGQILY